MNNTNHFISGDNKGAASLMLEKVNAEDQFSSEFQEMNPDHLAGQSPFVAAFASTNLGDVSPNTDGPKCQDTGLACDIEHSTCNGRFADLLLQMLTITLQLGLRCASPLVLAMTCLSRQK